MPRLHKETVGAEASIEDLETLLADVEIGDETDDVEGADTDTEVEIVEQTDEANEAELAAAVGEIHVEEAKREIYAAESTSAPVETKTVTKKGKKASKKESAPKKEKKESTPKTADALPGECFVLETTDNIDDLAALKTAVLARRPAQKKIAEKFDNILCAVAAGKKPSVYTMVAFRTLAAKGEATSADIVAAMQASGYTIGTSRSQTGQLMALFPILKIAERSGNKLTRNANSTLAEALRILDETPAAEASETA